MSLPIRIFQHLLPKSLAWNITVAKTLRSFFEGLGNSLIIRIKLFIDLVWLDMFPSTTRELAAWEFQLGLTNTNLTETERRARLAATWAAEGGQSPRYIQDTLQAAGFDVCVHEWWDSEGPPAVPRNPLIFIGEGGLGCGEAVAECGETDAECGAFNSPIGYPLVNKIRIVTQHFADGCGEAGMECGEEDASCGAHNGFSFSNQEYTIPNDPNLWPYFLYIGGESFGEPSFIDPDRFEEFEDLCLKICPAQQWLAMLTIRANEALLFTVRKDPILFDGDMEKKEVGDWTIGSNAVLTKDITNPHSGNRCLRITYGGTASPYASQSVMTVGYEYRVEGWARGDGVDIFPLIVDPTAGILWTGTISTEWQYFSETFVAADVKLVCINSSAAGGYAEYDDITLEQIDPVAPSQSISFELKVDTERKIIIRWGDGFSTEYIGDGTLTVFNHTYSNFPSEGTTVWVYGDVVRIKDIVIADPVEPNLIGVDLEGIVAASVIEVLDTEGATVTGDLLDLSASISFTNLDISNQAGIEGDINSLSTLVDLEELFLNDNEFTYTESTLPPWTDCHIKINNCGLTSVELDQFLIDLDVAGGVDGILSIVDNETRTAASDEAYTELLQKGWIIDGVSVTFMTQFVRSGFDNLDQEIIIQGPAVVSEGIYFAGAASADGWIAEVGTDLDYQAGTAPTFNDTSPLLGDSLGDDSILFNNGAYFDLPNKTDMQIITGDFAYHVYCESTASANEWFSGTYKGSDAGWQAGISGNVFSFEIFDGVGAQSVSATLETDSYNDIWVLCDRDYATGFVLIVNGVIVDTADPTGVQLTLRPVSDSAIFTLGADPGGSNPYGKHLTMIGLWEKTDWFDGATGFTAAAAAFGKEQHAELTRTATDRSLGDPLPSVATRNDPAYLDRLDANEVSSYYLMGKNYIRQNERLDVNGDILFGELSETVILNRISYSNLFSNWVKSDAGDTINDNASIAPTRYQVASDFIPDSTVGVHGFTNTATLTAATTVFSIHCRPREGTIIKLECTTIPNCYAWFDAETGDVFGGTIGAAATGLKKEGCFYAGVPGSGFSSGFSSGFNGGSICYRRFGISFMGTVAAHTFRVSVCDSDGADNYSGGDGAKIAASFWGAQVERNDHISSPIETTAGAAIRNQDNLEYVADDGNVENTQQGSMACNILIDNMDNLTTKRLVSISDGTSLNRITSYSSTTQNFSCQTRATAGSNGDRAKVQDISNANIYDTRVKWETNNLIIAVDGEHTSPDTNCDMPTGLNTINFAEGYTSVSQFNGIISKFRIINTPTDHG